MNIDPVLSKRDQRDFLQVPSIIYRGDDCYVRQPGFEERARIGPKNPYFEHARAQLFVARDTTGQPIGRISAQIDDLEQSAGADTDTAKIGHFGFLEAVDEPTMGRLIAAAEAWLIERGVNKVTGPFSFSINQESGLLIEGYRQPTRLLMNYALPWYGPALETFGYEKERDLLAFRFDLDVDISKATQKIAARSNTIAGLRARNLDPKNFAAEIRTVGKLFNDAWANNWGFVPMTDAEIHHMASSLKPVLLPDLVHIIEIDAKPIAMMVVLPDINEALTGLDGRLLPFGWAKFLWRLKVRGLPSARVILMGIASSWQKDGRSASLVCLLIARVYVQLRKLGYHELDMSWVLEDNTAMTRLIELVGCERYKRYRVYRKKLS